ncbi:MAG: chemotaxis protein CheD [Chloroflexi bacterium]|nr:chemotaxis protein CheD [Chloroflexota bacterium]
MKHIVGIADMIISANRDDEIVTHALGSCLGLTIYDPVSCVGGMLHVMLPDSTIDLAKAAANPYMFVDTGVPRLFLDCYKAGAQKSRLIVKVAGGASTGGDREDYFQIGKRNFVALRKLLWKNGVLLDAYDVGGTTSRGMTLQVGSGEVQMRINGTTTAL